MVGGCGGARLLLLFWERLQNILQEWELGTKEARETPPKATVFLPNIVGGSCAKGMMFEELVGPWRVDVVGPGYCCCSGKGFKISSRSGNWAPGRQGGPFQRPQYSSLT
jgi:hypothetical protein